MNPRGRSLVALIVLRGVVSWCTLIGRFLLPGVAPAPDVGPALRKGVAKGLDRALESAEVVLEIRLANRGLLP